MSNREFQASANASANKSACATAATIVSVSPVDIEVSVTRSSCEGCNGRCLGQLIGNTGAGSVQILRSDLVVFPEHLRVGDNVNLTVSRTTLIGLSSLAYLQPLVLMLLSGGLCYGFLSRADSMVALCMVVGLIVGLAGCKLLTDWFSRNTEPRISVAPVPTTVVSHSRSQP